MKTNITLFASAFFIVLFVNDAHAMEKRVNRAEIQFSHGKESPFALSPFGQGLEQGGHMTIDNSGEFRVLASMADDEKEEMLGVVEKAQAYGKKGEWKNALEHYEHAIQAFCSKLNPGIYLSAGYAAAMLKQYHRASSFFQTYANTVGYEGDVLSMGKLQFIENVFMMAQAHDGYFEWVRWQKDLAKMDVEQIFEIQ